MNIWVTPIICLCILNLCEPHHAYAYFRLMMCMYIYSFHDKKLITSNLMAYIYTFSFCECRPSTISRKMDSYLVSKVLHDGTYIKTCQRLQTASFPIIENFIKYHIHYEYGSHSRTTCKTIYVCFKAFHWSTQSQQLLGLYLLNGKIYTF